MPDLDEPTREEHVRDTLAATFRAESAGIHATLIRHLGDFDLAEEALADAFTSALRAWSERGIPERPGAWLTMTARRKGIDALRRRARRENPDSDALDRIGRTEDRLVNSLEDDRLRLIFTCCHPALAIEARVALTLRTLGGLTTSEIARAFLVPLPTMAQRLTRAKQKIRDAGIPYRVPENDELPERVPGVLAVIYLVFNEGYTAAAGDALIRRELCEEAIRLSRVLRELLPEDAEVVALLGLLLLQHSRRETRVDADGDVVLLDDQDRGRWDRDMIAEGLASIERASSRSGTGLRDAGPYLVQARIAAVHAAARTAEETDWRRIVSLYDELLAWVRSPVVELNRAAALANVEGPRAGLDALREIAGALDEYPYFHAARGELLHRSGDDGAARDALRTAMKLTSNEVERKHLRRRLDALG